MLFNSYQFLVEFLPAAIAIYCFADSYPRLRIPVLVCLSLVFYGCWDPRFLLVLTASILLNWLAAHAYAATRRGEIITAAIVADLATLFVFKYAKFFADNLNFLFGAPVAHLDIALPLGISFFTFHHVMYLADLRRGRAKAGSLLRYALYICFFPQAIAGPLARWSEVGHQYGNRVFAPGWERRCAVGVTYIVIGLVEKTMLADALGRALDPIYAGAASEPVSDGSAWFALAFNFQIFFDFSGYSDVAIGLGLIFGIELPQNFNAPFRATNILEFWQRWHMTFSRFLRDYLFLPLSDLRIAGRRHTTAHYLGAIFTTMALCGLWHGAGWNYVLWGALHGSAIIFVLAWRRFLRAPGRWIGWAATVGFCVLSSVLFRAGSLETAWHVYQGLAVVPGPGRISTTVGLCSVCALLLPATRDIVERLTIRPWPATAVATALSGVAILIELGGHESYGFIYFKF